MAKSVVDASRMELFWQLRSTGESYPQAADQAGISRSTARAALVASGGVRPRARPAPSGRFLSFAEREEIAVGLAGGLTPAAIATQLGRHRSTITREIARHRSAHDAKLTYRAGRSHWRAQRSARRPKPATLVGNLELRERVQQMLLENWSPEQIAATLKLEFPERPEMWVSHETIYQSLYVQSRGALRRELTTCLRTGRAIRHPKRRPQERRGRIKDMIPISERPAEVADRAVPGHWEGDLIIGKNGASAIGTLVERTTRCCLLLHLPTEHTAEAVSAAMLATIATLPLQLRRSLTWDQGSEMAGHAAITTATDMKIYFCDPHSPWQRGSNENTNGLLRQYFPKGTDLSVHSREHLDTIAAQLNRRPRKTLNWQTPAQRLNELLLQ
jgi:IS30 family transposase